MNENQAVQIITDLNEIKADISDMMARIKKIEKVIGGEPLVGGGLIEEHRHCMAEADRREKRLEKLEEIVSELTINKREAIAWSVGVSFAVTCIIFVLTNLDKFLK